MDAEWSKVEELFHAALACPEYERAGFLRRACASDQVLYREVSELLASQKKADGFLERGALPPRGNEPETDPVTAGGRQAESMRTGTYPGQQLGPYRIVGPLGAGGMGEVYRAHDNKLGRDVAIKMLPSAYAQDSAWLARFRREARALASLNHPNIAAIYGLEESGSVDCLVLELVEGEILRGPLPMAQALDCARQIAGALEAAHSKRIIHRDLKPANLKLTPEGRVKVLDFGLAKAVWGADGERDVSQRETLTAIQTQAGHIVGTPGYMSPEQALGQNVDERTDIWAFGCVFYELLTGKRAFAGRTVPEAMSALLERDPEWESLPAKTPAKIRELLRHCLQKEAGQRLAKIADAARAIEVAERGWNRWRIAAAAAAGLMVLAVAVSLSLRGPTQPPDRSRWTQLTKFPDSVTQPALSPDGRMVAFLRGDSTFFGPAQVYVKILPDGDPVQLTRDNLQKMSPSFSPDGARIAYTTVDTELRWDTWVVSVLGGEAQLLLRNASGLSWTGPQEVLFSEIKTGDHMGIVAAKESRAGERNIYMPAAELGMAHRSYLSPDSKWVLLVEMDIDHLWEPCRVAPADGSSPGRKVGPSGGGCTFGAWSPDGKWIYLTSNAVGGNHIWRQRFPDGELEQVTSGPTEEEGIAMAPDGRSFVTAMALQNTSLWVHDTRGERQISLEGNAAEPRFTPDGKKLLCRIVKEPPSEFGFYKDLGELRTVDLASGRSEPLIHGFQALDYDISPDGRQVVMETADQEGRPRLWLTPMDHSSLPRQLPNVEGGSPRFGAHGEIYFRGPAEHGAKFLYGVEADGTGIHKLLEQPIAIMLSVSPDGRWISAYTPLPGDGQVIAQILSLDGRPPIPLGETDFGWLPGAVWIGGADGKTTYIVPLPAGQVLPRIPQQGFRSDEEIARLPGARRVDAQPLAPGPSPDVYAFYRGVTQRNLQRVPIP